MTEPSSSSLLPITWVHKRDGRLAPFEPDKISQALFAATEALGRPDAFLARELTDGVLHFLAADLGGTTPTTAQIAEVVIKVVRELGQPALAQAFSEFARRRPPSAQRRAPSPEPRVPRSPTPDLAWQLGRASLRDFTLQQVFSRDLVSAHGDGLLTLTGLESPFELAGCVVPAPPPEPGRVLEAVEEARSVAGEYLVFDGPDHALAATPGRAGPDGFLRELSLGLRATRLRAVLNLNCASPPAWANELAEGPLFAGHRRPAVAGGLAATSDALLEATLARPGQFASCRVDWHLGEADLAEAARGRLLRVARVALGELHLTFTLDRPRRTVALGEGMDRQHPGVLLAVGLHLPRLLEQLPDSHSAPAGAHEAVALFLQKLGSLARLALSAAAQKRAFLRRTSPDRPALGRGFLLDRARLVVVPVGIEACARRLRGEGPAAGGPALDFARQAVRRLHEVLREDGLSYRLDTCLDSCPFPAPAPEEAEENRRRLDEGGLTAWDATAPAKQQLRAAGMLQAVTGTGTAVVLVPPEQSPGAEEVVHLLRCAWQQLEVVRVRFLRAAPLLRQQTAAWAVGEKQPK